MPLISNVRQVDVSIHPYDFIFTGLACDIAGAVILAKGFMFKEARAAFYESRTVGGGNSHLLKSALLQRAEAQVGGLFLILGFVLQIWGNFHGGIAAIEYGWLNSITRMFAMLLCIAGLSFLCLHVALRWARATFYQIFFLNYKGEDMTIPEGDPTLFDRMAQLIDLKRRRKESNIDLLGRVNARRKVIGSKYAGKGQGLTREE